MNKTITIYELLGMIKDGKAPKKVKWKNNIYIYVYDDDREANIINYYYSVKKHCHLIDGGQHDIRLNDEVEILEEEKKIPEKIDDILRVDDLVPPVDENMYKIWTQAIKNQNKINEIIDYLKSKGE